MSSSGPRFVVASSRETGAQCRHCNREVEHGEPVAVCPRCGGVNHEACWNSHGGCGSYDCAPMRRVLGPNLEPSLRITADELLDAPPLAAQGSVAAPSSVVPAPFPPVPSPRRVNRMALASLVVAVAGIPLFGVLTGIVAIVLASLALGSIRQTRQAGTAWALSGLFLGLADVVGWVVFLALTLSSPPATVSIDEFEPDLAALENLPPHINRALRANVLIETRRGRGIFASEGIGSGVILRIREGTALVLTNRHVVDPDFSDDRGGETVAGPKAGRLGIKLINQPVRPGQLVWTAPDGIDLALVSVPVSGDDARAAQWRDSPRLAVGDEVFSIGNPQHLDWSHTRGVISQLRLHTRGPWKVHVIQTDSAINPGNSGGGLYDKEGMLIGINTWTNDKRVSEGLSFAIAFETLRSLRPPALADKTEAIQP